MRKLYDHGEELAEPLEGILNNLQVGAVIFENPEDETGRGENLAIVYDIAHGIPYPGLAFIRTPEEGIFYVLDNTSQNKIFRLTDLYSAVFYQMDKVTRRLDYHGTQEEFIADLEAREFQFDGQFTEFSEIAGTESEWFRRATELLEAFALTGSENIV